MGQRGHVGHPSEPRPSQVGTRGQQFTQRQGRAQSSVSIPGPGLQAEGARVKK